MIVQDLMRETVGIVGARQSLGCARRLMRRGHLDALVVVEGEKLAGILTRSDIERHSREPDRREVRSAMSDEVLVSHADEPVEQCATRMAFHGIQQMPVVEDASGRILGMVTFADIRRANPRDV